MSASHSDSLPSTFNNIRTRGDELAVEIEDALARVHNNDPDIDFEYVVERLREAQVELLASRNECADLRAQVADFALSYATRASAARQNISTPGPTESSQLPEGSAARRQAPAIADGKQLDALISYEATYFSMFFTPSVPHIAFYIPCPAFAHDSPLRFVQAVAAAFPAASDPDINAELQALTPTAVTSLRGLTAELYHAIPEAYHSYMSISHQFPKKFGPSVQGIRSDKVLRLRNVAERLFGLPQSLFTIPKEVLAPGTKAKTSAATRASAGTSSESTEAKKPPIDRLANDRVKHLIGYTPGGRKGDYMLTPPVLYEDSDNLQVSGLFRSNALIEAGHVVLYGPNAAAPRSNNPFFRGGRVVTTTIGFIATLSGLLIFLLSNDVAFTANGKGDYTKINHLTNIESLKRTIINLRISDPDWYEQLIGMWNQRLFPKTAAISPSAPYEDIDIGVTDEIQSLMEQLHLENEARRHQSETTGAGIGQPDVLAEEREPEHHSDSDIYVSDVESAPATINRRLPGNTDIPAINAQFVDLAPTHPPPVPEMNSTSSRGEAQRAAAVPRARARGIPRRGAGRPSQSRQASSAEPSESDAGQDRGEEPATGAVGRVLRSRNPR